MLDPNFTQDLPLYDVLKNSYASVKNQKQNMNGYIRDAELSNDNQQTYYNPSSKKLLVSVSGTHNISDLGTDAYLALGHLKDTNRYKEADNILNRAKSKYNTDHATIAAHSLGGSIGQYIGSSKDKVITLDKGATIGTPTRGNENAYRSAGDAVSLLNANATRTKTLNNNSFLGNHKYALLGSFLGPGGALLGGLVDTYKSHDINNIAHEKIFV
jgi:hypothetical protein